MSIETTPIEENEAATLVMTHEGRREVMNRLEFDLHRTAARLRGMAQAHLVLGNDLQAAELHNTAEIVERADYIFLLVYIALVKEADSTSKGLQDAMLQSLLQGASPDMKRLITTHIEGKQPCQS